MARAIVFKGATGYEVSTVKRRPSAPLFSTRPVRHRRLGPGSPRVRQFPGRDGSAVVASLAAGANGFQEFTLSVALVVRGESTADQSRGAGRAGLAERAGDSRPLGLASRRG